MTLANQPLIILDGATGTTLQTMDIPDSVWDSCEGCNEYLNISSPETIIEMHSLFLEAGAVAIETNSFGGSSIVLAEYGLENRVKEINTAAVNIAKKAIETCDSTEKKYIIGSIGPTTKLPVLGHIEPDALTTALREQIISLIEAGVDALLVETCQDLLQVKLTLITCFEILEKLDKELPVLCSVTMEKLGTMLVGTDIGAVVATIAPFPVFSLGLNCATGPEDMTSHITYLKNNWKGRISCYPNQGMPEVVNGQTCYPMTPDQFGQHMYKFVTEDGVSIVGGCCGTSPAHIKQLSNNLKNATVARI